MVLDSEIDGMSMKELKALITGSGLSFHDCTEKSELKTRARQAIKTTDEAASAADEDDEETFEFDQELDEDGATQAASSRSLLLPYSPLRCRATG